MSSGFHVRMSFQVRFCAREIIWIFLKKPQNGIASSTKKPAYVSRIVTMIDAGSSITFKGLRTDKAFIFLLGQHGIHLLGSNVVLQPEPRFQTPSLMTLQVFQPVCFLIRQFSRFVGFVNLGMARLAVFEKPVFPTAIRGKMFGGKRLFALTTGFHRSSYN